MNMKETVKNQMDGVEETDEIMTGVRGREANECDLKEKVKSNCQSTTASDIDGLLERLALKVNLTTHKYEFSVLEQLRYEAFAHRHKDCGGPITVSFTPTGIGCVVELTCRDCGASADITDVSSW